MGKTLKEKFKEANVRHYSQFDSVLSKYMSVREEDDASISVGEIGADVSSEVYDGEEDDELEVDFKKIFSTKPNKYGNDNQKKYTSTPRANNTQSALKKKSKKQMDSSSVIDISQEDPPKAFKKPSKVSDEAQTKLLSYFNFKKTANEPEIRLEDVDNLGNDVFIPSRSKQKTKQSNENETTVRSINLGTNKTSRPSLTLVSAVNSPNLAQPTQHKEPEPKDGQDILDKIIQDWKDKHGGRCLMQPELLRMLTNNSAMSSSKTKEQLAEEEKQAREAALKYKPRKRTSDPLFELVQNAAKLPIIPKKSSQ